MREKEILNAATCLNKVELIGTIGSIRYQNIDEKQAAAFALATNTAYMDSSGYLVIDTQWTLCRAKAGKDIHELSDISKNDKVHLTGRLATRTRTSATGDESKQTVVIVTSLEKIEMTEPLKFEKI